MENEEKSRLRGTNKKETGANKPKKSVNFWKWTTLGLLGLIIGLIVAVYFAIGGRGSTITPPTKVSNDEPAISIQLTKDRTNRLVNYYLNDYLKDSKIKYSFVLDQDAQLNGSFPFFNQSISFTLSFSPETQKNGDVLLRAKQLNVGSLNVPIEYVLGYVQKSYKIPKWVQMDPKSQTILLRLTDLKTDGHLQLRANDIDLANDNISFGLYLPKAKE